MRKSELIRVVEAEVGSVKTLEIEGQTEDAQGTVRFKPCQNVSSSEIQKIDIEGGHVPDNFTVTPDGMVQIFYETDPYEDQEGLSHG